MKQKISLLLAVCLLCFMLIGCGTAKGLADKDTGTKENASMEAQTSNVENDSTSTETDGAISEDDEAQRVPISPPVSPDVETTSVTRYSVTLQNVIFTDEFGNASDMAEWLGEEKNSPEDRTYYNLGMIGIWSEEDQVWGYRTLWAYLLPPNASVTFHVSGEDKHFYLDAYTLEEVEEVIEGSRTWNATEAGGYTSDELEDGDYTLTLKEIQEYIPEFDFLACCVGDNEWVEIVIWNA